MITECAQAGDPFAVEQLADLGRWLGEGVASLAAVLDPAVVVVGGGVSAAGDLLLEPIRAAFARELTGRGHRPLAEVRLARLGNRAGPDRGGRPGPPPLRSRHVRGRGHRRDQGARGRGRRPRHGRAHGSSRHPRSPRPRGAGRGGARRGGARGGRRPPDRGRRAGRGRLRGRHPHPRALRPAPAVARRGRRGAVDGGVERAGDHGQRRQLHRAGRDGVRRRPRGLLDGPRHAGHRHRRGRRARRRALARGRRHGRGVRPPAGRARRAALSVRTDAAAGSSTAAATRWSGTLVRAWVPRPSSTP